MRSSSSPIHRVRPKNRLQEIGLAFLVITLLGTISTLISLNNLNDFLPSKENLFLKFDDFRTPPFHNLEEENTNNNNNHAFQSLTKIEYTNQSWIQSKLNAALECTKCRNHRGPILQQQTNFSTDIEDLKQHYQELVQLTKPFRPEQRSPKVLYQGYWGPRLEDHFIQHMIDVPFLETFFPLVPLFIHWTELNFGRIGGGRDALNQAIGHKLRPDAIYVTVTSDHAAHISSALGRNCRNIIIASSKGDRIAPIILPHLFVYNTPGYDRVTGKPIWNLPKDDHHLNFEYEPNIVTNQSSWKYKDYDSFTRMPVLGNATDTLPPNHHPQLTFMGKLYTHKRRGSMSNQLKNKTNLDYFYGEVGSKHICPDTSVPSGTSVCWRTYMLSANVNICPVGSAPVSYRLYEALQMGVICIYVHDQKGPFVPYNGTKADVREFGWVVSFDELEQLVDNVIVHLTDEDLAMKRKKILQYRDTHFTPAGAMTQLRKWLARPHSVEASDVRCCTNPS